MYKTGGIVVVFVMGIAVIYEPQVQWFDFQDSLLLYFNN